eukprot:Nk52_evm4s554 gene=Nk52_evmTU4s554
MVLIIQEAAKGHSAKPGASPGGSKTDRKNDNRIKNNNNTLTSKLKRNSNRRTSSDERILQKVNENTYKLTTAKHVKSSREKSSSLLAKPKKRDSSTNGKLDSTLSSSKTSSSSSVSSGEGFMRFNFTVSGDESFIYPSSKSAAGATEGNMFSTENYGMTAEREGLVDAIRKYSAEQNLYGADYFDPLLIKEIYDEAPNKQNISHLIMQRVQEIHHNYNVRTMSQKLDNRHRGILERVRREQEKEVEKLERQFKYEIAKASNTHRKQLEDLQKKHQFQLCVQNYFVQQGDLSLDQLAEKSLLSNGELKGALGREYRHSLEAFKELKKTAADAIDDERNC